MKNIMYTSTATTNFQGIKYLQNNIEINCKISEPERNWAFIDIQNLYKEVKKKGWQINWKLFRQYLQDKYDVTKAVIFLGYIEKYSSIYQCLRDAGFILEFRTVIILKNGNVDGGNIDADLASYVMDNKTEYRKAIIVADDGDYCNTVESLVRQNKLEKIISSHSFKKTSFLLKKVAFKSIISIQSIKYFIEKK